MYHGASIVRNYRHRIRRVRRVFRLRSPDVVVLAEDNVGHASGIFTKVARENQTPVIVVPYTIANALEFAESYFDVPEHQYSNWPNWMIAPLLPKWVYAHKGKRLMRLPGWHVVAHELYRLAPPTPWALNSGQSDAILVESPRAAEYYRRAGLRNERIVVTGGIHEDALADQIVHREQRREALYRDLDLPPARPLILCALPPDQLPSRPQCDFKDFHELIAFWCEPLSRMTGHNVVVRLHPRLNLREFSYIEREFGLRIATVDTLLLVPLCDVYLACVSATIRWAIACGKPVINYDVFRYQYDDYDDAPGVVTFEEQRDYTETMKRIAADRGFVERVGRHQRQCMSQWGHMDGRTGERILEVFDELTRSTRGATNEDRRHRNGANGPAPLASGVESAA